MKITIKLLSDLCTASGETHNSMVDTDIVYDEYGIPYIPAKRIKGCIREAALEMMEIRDQAFHYPMHISKIMIRQYRYFGLYVLQKQKVFRYSKMY